jgi:hypothetical protein
MAPSREVGSNGNRSIDQLLGELIAEVRSVKHNQNDASAKLDAVNHLIEQVKDIRREQERHATRITVLEADKLRREGAVGLVEWISRHWPFTVLITALGAFIAWANGRFG